VVGHHSCRHVGWAASGTRVWSSSTAARRLAQVDQDSSDRSVEEARVSEIPASMFLATKTGDREASQVRRTTERSSEFPQPGGGVVVTPPGVEGGPSDKIR